MSNSLSHENWPENIAITLNTSRIAIEMIETTIANLNEMFAPAAVEPMNTA